MYKKFEFSVESAKRLKIKHIVALITSVIMLIVLLIANILVLHEFNTAPEGDIKIIVSTGRYTFRMILAYVFGILGTTVIVSVLIANIKDCLMKYTDKQGKPLVSLNIRDDSITYTNSSETVEAKDIYYIKALRDSYLVNGKIVIKRNGKTKYTTSYPVPKVFKGMEELCDEYSKV